MTDKEALKNIETLSILLEHFKEMEERMDALEKKRCKCKNGS